MPPSDAERLITTPSARDALAAALTPHTRLALDTESNSMFAHTERLCLVQLAWGDAADPAVSAIDPLAFGPREAAREALGPVVDFWRDPARTIVAHGAGYDVAILRRDLGEAPRRLFDTQIAATLLGLPRTGYAPLVGELLGAQLSKSHQQHDWGLRPIPAAALTYAFNDARHLLRLADALTERVTAADLVEEVALACAAVLETAPHAPRPPDEAFWRLALGDGPPPPRPALLRLAVLFSWREALAARLDHPAGRVLNSALALELARRPPEDEATLKRRLPGRISETDRAALFSALSQAESQATLPPRPPRPPEVKPAVRAREKALKAWREATATARGVGAQAILPTPTLTWLAERGPAGLADAPQLGEARLRRYGAAIREVLARNP